MIKILGIIARPCTILVVIYKFRNPIIKFLEGLKKVNYGKLELQSENLPSQSVAKDNLGSKLLESDNPDPLKNFKML